MKIVIRDSDPAETEGNRVTSEDPTTPRAPVPVLRMRVAQVSL